MARAAQVRPGQVWADVNGRQLEVLQQAGPDGRYLVKNVGTGRTMSRGPRALIQLVREAAPQGYGQQGYGQQQAVPSFGGVAPPAQRPNPWGGAAPPVDFDEEEFDENPPEVGFPSMGEGPPPMAYAPPTPPRRAPPRRAPPVRRKPPVPAAAAPRNGHATPGPRAGAAQPGGYPSELTAFVAGKLAAMRPDLAQSPMFVSREVAGALAEWKARNGY